jgi:hypothetical protein
MPEHKTPKEAARPAPEIEIEPDAWDRFKSMVHQMAKSPPKTRKSKAAKGKA